MDVNKLFSNLNVFSDERDEREDPYVGLKSSALLLLALGLLTFPPSALRWDGSIRTATDRAPLTKIEADRLQPNAVLNRTLRVLAAMFGLGAAAYAAKLDQDDMKLQEELAPLRNQMREARRILEEEHLNNLIVRNLPPAAKEEPKQLAPANTFEATFAEILAKGDDDDTDYAALAGIKKEKEQKPAAVKARTVAEGLKSRNVEINEAIAVAEKGEVPEGEEGEPDPDRFKPFEKIGRNILNGMAITEKSILIASGTGTGKTTTEQHLLQELIKNYPTTKFYALLQKNDQLIGVPDDRRYVFDNLLLTQYVNQGKLDPESGEERIALFDIVAPIVIVHREFYRRKQLPATEREHLKETHPIRLILGDWFATYEELSRLERKDRDNVMSMIRQIITVGRDSGVALIVDSQSAALVSLGLAEDASIRESLDIYSQGFVRREKGREKGEVRTMMHIINNNSMVSKEDREGLTNAYLLLTNAIQSKEIKSPIIFTTVGSVPTIGIVPDLSDMTVRHTEKPSTAAAAVVVEPDPLAQAFNQEAKKRVENFIEEQEEVFRNEVNLFHQTIHLIIAKAAPPCSFENIRTARVWVDGRPKSADLRDALEILIRQEKIQGDEDDGYISLVNPL